MSGDTKTTAQHIAAYINKQLEEGKSVLWLVSGGSAVGVAVQVRNLLGPLSSNNQLHVALIDERFGEPGHADSNERQLLDAGFDLSKLTFHPVLAGHDIDKTTRDYDAKLVKLVSKVDSIIGLFGMGSDGHTAGLLPGNPLMGSSSLVGHFDGPDYQRITITPAFIRQVDQAVLYAVGRAKWPTLRNLTTTNLPVASLHGAKNLVVFSDYKEEKL